MKINLPVIFLNILLTLLLFCSLLACRKESELLTTSPSSGLRFSADTVYFDTVFTTRKTVTLRVRVYNENDNAVNISSVYIANADGKTPFSFYINGRFGPVQVADVALEGKDSAYVLISATLDARNQDLPFLVEDSLMFQIQGRNMPQRIRLTAYGQDAVYYRGEKLACNTTWKKNRPVIIMDTVSVPPGCTLTVEAGARVHGYNGAALLVRGTLLVEGSPTDSVIFQGTRMERYYQNVPGQWFGIWFFDGSQGNRIENALIKNAYRALQVGEVGKVNDEKASLFLLNSRIQNVVDYGLLGLQAASVIAVNNQFADFGEAAFAGYQGGRYELWHNTFGESGNNPFQRESPMVAFTNHFPPNNNWQFGAGLYAKLVNNIVAGGEDDELIFVDRVNNPQAPLDTFLFGNIIKAKDFNHFIPTPRSKENLKMATGARFKSPFLYNLSPDSATFMQANRAGLAFDTMTSRLLFPISGIRDLLKTDIRGKARILGERPDAGAWQISN